MGTPGLSGVRNSSLAVHTGAGQAEVSGVQTEERQHQILMSALPGNRPLTVVTASLPTAAVLAAGGSATVLLLGGRVRGRTLATVDHWTTQMLSGFVLDLAFIGANGISRKRGLTTPDPAVAEV